MVNTFSHYISNLVTLFIGPFSSKLPSVSLRNTGFLVACCRHLTASRKKIRHSRSRAINSSGWHPEYDCVRRLERFPLPVKQAFRIMGMQKITARKKRTREGGGGQERRERLPANPNILKNARFLYGLVHSAD